MVYISHALRVTQPQLKRPITALQSRRVYEIQLHRLYIVTIRARGLPRIRETGRQFSGGSKPGRELAACVHSPDAGIFTVATSRQNPSTRARNHTRTRTNRRSTVSSKSSSTETQLHATRTRRLGDATPTWATAYREPLRRARSPASLNFSDVSAAATLTLIRCCSPDPPCRGMQRGCACDCAV